MIRPKQIEAMRAAMEEVSRARDRFRIALVNSNDSAHQDFFGDLLVRLGLILDNEKADNTLELATDLHKLRQDIRRLRLPDIDPDFDEPTPALSALRSERGNLVEALDNALEAASVLGMEPRLADQLPVLIARDTIRDQLIRLDERLRGLQIANEKLELEDRLLKTRSHTGFNLLSVHVNSLKVEVSGARFETKLGRTGSAQRTETDLTALARTTEAIRDIGRDLKAATLILAPFLPAAARAAGSVVSALAERAWNGTRALIRATRRQRPMLAESSLDPTQLLDAARLAGRSYRYEEASHLFHEAASLFHRHRNTLGEARCFEGLGEIDLARSEHAGARQYYETALKLYRQLGNLVGEATCVMSLGDIARRRFDPADALSHYEAALLLFRKAGDVGGEARSVLRQGDIALRALNHAQAQSHYQAALPLYRQVSDLVGEADCIMRLGNVAERRSDPAEALSFHQTALRRFRQAGDVRGEANCLNGLGNTARRRSDLAEARSHYEAALLLFRRVGDFRGEAIVLGGLSDLAKQEGRIEEARSGYHDALVIQERIGDEYNVEITRRRLAELDR